MCNKYLKRAKRRIIFSRVVDAVLPVLFLLYAAALLIAVIFELYPRTETIEASEKIETPVVEVTEGAPKKKPVMHTIKAIDPMEEVLPAAPEPPVDTAEPAKELVYYDVPMDEDLQEFIIKVCDAYSIEPSLVFAMIERESRFKPHVIGDNGRSYGLMQIQPRWHQARMDKLGVTDLLDPYQNVMVGIDYLAELFHLTDDVEWVLMAYNGGMSYANRLAGNGTVSAYAAGVLDAAREMRDEVM